jgi:myo-inositol-hexaphosphate 3-phosphohydrolase
VQVPVGRAVITSRLSGKALEVENASQDDGANVIQWTYNGIPNQQWDIADAGNGYYTIRAAHSGKSLDVYNFSTEEGGEIRQWSFTGGANQRWRFCRCW